MGNDTADNNKTKEEQTVGKLDRKLRWLNEGISSVNETSRLLTSPMDLQQVLEVVVKTIAEVLRVEAAGLRLLDEDTGELVLKATYGLSDEYKSKGPVTAAESELNRRALHGTPVIVRDMRTDSHFIRYRDDILREGVISSLSIGLLFHNKGIGILRLYSKRPRRFPPTDIALAQTVAGQSAAAIVNARLYAEALEADRMARQMKLAGEVQRHLIPQKAPQIPGIDLMGLYVPCYDVGGDFFDFIPMSNGQHVMVIGDVMGKGVPASLAMASLRSSMRAYAEEIENLDELMRRVNRMFCHDTDPGEFATLFCCRFDPENNCLTYCNAGHEPPLIFNKNREDVTALSEGGMVMGIASDIAYQSSTIELTQGDMMIMYTDGLGDAMNFERESFGRERIINAARSSLDMDAEQAAKNILWLMRKFTGLTKRFDDTALVVMKKL